MQCLSSLGTTEPTKEEVNAVHRFVVSLYGGQKKTLLDIRCKLALRKSAPQKLPPTENSLHQHILRVAYQLFLWRGATTGMLDVIDVTKFGWERDVNSLQLQPVMMTQPCAPPELLNDLICCCQKCIKDCYCLLKNQFCTADSVCRAAFAGSVNTEENGDVCNNPIILSLLHEMYCKENFD